MSLSFCRLADAGAIFIGAVWFAAAVPEAEGLVCGFIVQKFPEIAA